MAKTATAEKTETRKPTIRFCPKIRQYEAGIDYVDLQGFKRKITLEGTVAPTFADEQRLLRMMEADPFCGITTWENRQMPPEQKQAESEVRKLQAKNEAMAVEMEAMRAELEQLRKTTKPSA